LTAKNNYCINDSSADTNIKKTSSVFKEKVIPKLKELGVKGEFVNIEDSTTKEYKNLVRYFDQKSSIDVWVVISNGIYGLASRIQQDNGYIGYPFNTFTIRKSTSNNMSKNTEYYKLLNAKKLGLVMPMCHCQVFMDKGFKNILSLAMIKTTHLLDAIDKNNCYIRSNAYDGNEFYCVEWKSLADSGYKILLYPIQCNYKKC
jgi:hypothetical protein